MEPVAARKVFPCADEPALKSNFEISVTIPEDRDVISNMEPNNVIVKGKFKTVSFDKTPKMSTYLFAIVVGNFDVVEDKTASGVIVRVYTPVGEKHRGHFALNVAKQVITFFDEYFATPYPLPKLVRILPHNHLQNRISLPFLTLQQELWRTGVVTSSAKLLSLLMKSSRRLCKSMSQSVFDS